MSNAPLIQPDEPDPVAIERSEGRSRFFVTVDHGGRLLPRALGDLGLPERERERHIAWDIGAAGVARRLARMLDATVVRQIYSRLVCDCNRPPEAPDFAPARSENTEIPGNRNLAAAELAMRRAAVWQPYHDRIAALLDARAAAGRLTVLVAMHSFTPVYNGASRPWQVGLLYNRDRRLADGLRKALADERLEGQPLAVGDNEPYRLTDETDYTIPVHGERRGLLHIEIELRQDLIAEAVGQAAWAERMGRVLENATESIS
jgi:predicted N-formylglutamate amidohydrolase